MTLQLVLFSTSSLPPFHDYEYSGRTPEALDEGKCITLLNSLINPVLICVGITRVQKSEKKGVGLTAQQVMKSIIDYFKVPVTIQSYAKVKSYAMATGTPSDPNDNRHGWRRSAMVATSSTS